MSLMPISKSKGERIRKLYIVMMNRLFLHIEPAQRPTFPEIICIYLFRESEISLTVRSLIV